MAYASPPRGGNYPLPPCTDDVIGHVTRVDLHDSRDYLYYTIAAGEKILRADPTWVMGGQTQKTDIISMVRDPTDFGERKVVYFGYEDGRPFNEEGTRRAIDVLADSYGHVLSFVVTRPITLLAIDYPKSREWLKGQMGGNDLLKGYLDECFTPEGGKRKSDADKDAAVAVFICGLKRPDGSPLFDGYGASRQFYPNFHAELALCAGNLRAVPVEPECVAKVDYTLWLKRPSPKRRWTLDEDNKMKGKQRRVRLFHLPSPSPGTLPSPAGAPVGVETGGDGETNDDDNLDSPPGLFRVRRFHLPPPSLGPLPSPDGAAVGDVGGGGASPIVGRKLFSS